MNKEDSSGKTFRKNKMYTRARNINMSIFASLLILVTVLSAVVISGINESSLKELSASYSSESAGRLHSFYVHDLILIQKASRSKAWAEWFEDEENQEKKKAAFDEMADYFYVCPDSRMYFGIQKTLNEYAAEKGVTIDNVAPFGPLDPSNGGDSWFFDCMESKYDYAFNIDIDTKSSNTWHLWINHKITNNGNAIGAICAGINLQNIMQKIFGGYNDKNIIAYIIDKDGTVLLDNTIPAPYVREQKNSIYDLQPDAAFVSALNGHLQSIDGYFTDNTPVNPGSTVKLSKSGYASISPISGSDWSVIVFVKSNMSSDMTRLLPLLIALLSALVLYVVGSNALLKIIVFKPINLFAQSIAAAGSDGTNIYGRERNDEIGELARNTSSVFAMVRRTNALTKLLLNATPLACHMWDKDFNIIELNDVNIKLFKLQDKQQIIDDYFAFFPEYQPNGRLSKELAYEMFTKTFEEGTCVFEWVHQTLDGELIPSEVTLVRLNFGEDDLIAGYTRDLREYRKMMDKIQKGSSLLRTANKVASTLLTTADDADIGALLINSMAFIGHDLGVDRVQIWQNEMIDGALHFVLAYEWLSDIGRLMKPVPVGLKFSYSTKPEWEKVFRQGKHINGPLSEMSADDQEFLGAYGIKTFVIIPLFSREQFWGFFSIDDCEFEYTLSEDEIGILRSASLMMVSAINRREQAAKIREAHDRTKILLDSMPLSCRLWNKNMKIFDFNRESLRLFDLEDGYAFAEKYFDLSPEYQPDGILSKEKAAMVLQKAFEEGRHVTEWVNQMPDGTLIPTEITLVRVPYGDDFAVAGYTRDLREHKMMMLDIERRDYLQSVMNDVSGILLKSEIDGFGSDIYCCMNMMNEALDIGRISIWENFTENNLLYYRQVIECRRGVRPPENNDWCVEKEARCYSKKVPTWEARLSKGECLNSLVDDLHPVESQYLSSLGVLSIFVAPVFMQDRFWGFVSYDDYQNKRIFTEDEKITMLSGAIAITNALQRNEMLLNIRDSSKKLEEALEKARKASNVKSDFLANMSHEMRTPLNAVIGLAALNLENDGLEEETRDNLEKIYSAGSTLLSTVNDILDISKIEAGKLDLTPVDYDVPSLVNDTMTQNLLRVGEKAIELKLDIGEDTFSRLHGDELRVKQIVNNLLSNAIKYTNEGVVELSVHCVRENERVWLTISVRDTGRGIKPEDIGKLFNDYIQLDMESNRKIEGTGLGLPISKKLAEMMDGSITVESEYGKGSVFTVRIAQGFSTDVHIGQEVVENLKSFRYSAGKHSRNTRLNRIRLPYARVLVVDDNVTNMDVARGLMKPYGMQIDCMSDGRQAIDAISSGKIKYDAIFMDHMMPGMDGIEATQEIRKLDSDYARNIPIIALTANAIVGNEAMFLSKGFQAFLSKPIDLPRLDEIIRRWVRDKSREGSFEDGEIQDNGQTNGQTETARRMFKAKIAGLNIAGALERFSGDGATYLDVLRSYAVNTLPLIERIRTVNKENLADYAISIHGIKGSSRGICAETVGDLAERLEHASKSGDFEFVNKNNAGLIAIIEKLVAGIKDLIAEMDEENPKPKKYKPDTDLLQKLLEFCDAYNMDGADSVIAELDLYEYESGKELASWLRDNVSQGNFIEITEMLTAFMGRDV